MSNPSGYDDGRDLLQNPDDMPHTDDHALSSSPEDRPNDAFGMRTYVQIAD